MGTISHETLGCLNAAHQLSSPVGVFATLRVTCSLSDIPREIKKAASTASSTRFRPRQERGEAPLSSGQIVAIETARGGLENQLQGDKHVCHR